MSFKPTRCSPWPLPYPPISEALETNLYTCRVVSGLETIFKSGKVRQKDPITPTCKGITKAKIRLSCTDSHLGFPFLYAVSETPMDVEIDHCLKYLQVNGLPRRGIPARSLG
jgi:hypothetical protein